MLSLPAIAVLGLIAFALVRAHPKAAGVGRERPFPLWGWLGLAIMAAGWFAAWSEANDGAAAGAELVDAVR